MVKVSRRRLFLYGTVLNLALCYVTACRLVVPTIAIATSDIQPTPLYPQYISHTGHNPSIGKLAKMDQ